MTWWGWLIVGAVALVALHLGLCALEDRGLINYRKPRARSSAGVLWFQEIFQPNQVHQVQEQRSQYVRRVETNVADGDKRPDQHPPAEPERPLDLDQEP